MPTRPIVAAVIATLIIIVIVVASVWLGTWNDAFAKYFAGAGILIWIAAIIAELMRK
ncbi:MAG: hypothetical protein ABSE39_12980 [Candidatus Bathyarchaeia archaeon]